MERRALIAVIISVVILILYQELVIKRFFPPASAPAPVPTAGSDRPGEAPPAAQQPPAPSADTTATAAVGGSDVVVDTDLYRAVFTTAGARLKSFELKNYRASVAADSPPLQMVQHPDPNRLPLGVSLRGAKPIDDRGVLYRADQERLEVTGGGDATVTFTGELAGATISKRIAVHGDTYVWKVDVDASGVPPAYNSLGIAWDEGGTLSAPKGVEVVYDALLVLHDDKLEHTAFTSIPDIDAAAQQGTVAVPLAFPRNVAWLGYGGRYFLAALVPLVAPENALQVDAERRGASIEARVLLPANELALRAEAYVGPKNIDRLEAAGHGLRRAVDLGFFSFVALPMLQALRFLYTLTSNYGIAIIVLTILVKIIFYPLTKKSFQSMREMQKLQPEMQKLRERLKDKPEEMNKEIMELYRRHKVNPLGGCLPMLLQLPVLFGLYSALQNAIELRHAPFMFWITDLSAPDRLGAMHLPFVEPAGVPVMTVVMGASMFVQQWMTPAAGDPQQQKVMMLMPLMMTFMFMNLPAGLTLYWLVNNILTIAQQAAMMRQKR